MTSFAKATLIFFSAKNTCKLDILLIRTVNFFIIKEHVKLTMFEQLGPGLL